MSIVFNLENVSVAFEKHAARNHSLKYFLDSLLRRQPKSRFYALSEVNLSITEGEHVGLIGRNGAGKSTLLRVLARIIIPQSGQVHISGNRTIVPMLELGIGFQPDLSGRENCYLTGALMGFSESQMSRKIDDIIKFSELYEFIDEPVRNYSSGMYARLAFTLATDVDPEVLLVDEVFGVGDEFFMRKCIVRMQRLMKSGTTTVFVSHNIDFLVAQCNRLIWLDKGKIAMDGDSMRIASAYRKAEGFSQ